MKTFEVRAAYVMGFALPILETLRRRTNFAHLAMYVDDYIAGIILLIAAVAVTRGRPWGPALLAGAWGILVGGLYGSFFGQLDNELANDISGLNNWVVVVIKGIAFAISIVCFVRSVMRATKAAARPSPGL